MFYNLNMRIILVNCQSESFYIITNKSNSKIRTINKKKLYISCFDTRFIHNCLSYLI